MPAATAVTVLDRPSGHFQQFTFVLDPGSIAAGATETETVALPGCQIGDVITALSPGVAVNPGLIIGVGRVSAAGTITFQIDNNSAGALDMGSSTWTGMLMRGTTMAIRS